MAKLRHIAIATQDPETTAAFYREAFEFAEVGRTDAPLGTAIYLSDGTLNIAIVRFKTDQLGRGMDYVGLHHLGFLVDDADAASRKLSALGADCLVARPEKPKGFFEIKHRGPDGVVLDLSDHPWIGSAPLPTTQEPVGS